MADEDLEALFLAELPRLERYARKLCRLRRMSAAEGEDFFGDLRLKLIENDYARLRAFHGRSRFSTYLASIARNLFQDYCNQRWGRYRASLAAQRLGEPALQLERLVNRDGLSLDEACETLQAHPALGLSGEACRELAARLPLRPRRRMVSDEVLAESADPEPDPERRRLRDESEAARAQVAAALAEERGRLGEEDRLLMRLHGDEGLTLAHVARLQGCEVRLLYRRWDALCKRLRRALAARGLRAPD